MTRTLRLQTDWLGVDGRGHYALFLGDDTSHSPHVADEHGTSSLIETIRASFNGFSGASIMSEAYRSPAHRAREPVFDVPRASAREALHEQPFSGYPLLIVATADGAALVRQAMVALRGREALTRGPFAVVVDDIGSHTYAQLHAAGACAGCRVLDEAADPRPRSPELLAAVGLYVYGWSAGSWSRITSPGVPVDGDDVQALGGVGVGVVRVEALFDDTPWLGADLGPA